MASQVITADMLSPTADSTVTTVDVGSLLGTVQSRVLLARPSARILIARPAVGGGHVGLQKP